VAEPVPAPHNVRHAIYTGITAIVVAAVSSFGAVRVAHVNQQTEFAKASLGYSKVADHMTQVDSRIDGLSTNVGVIMGTQKEMNELLQNFLQSNTGVKHIDTPPPDVKTYGELPGADRPYRRYPIGRRTDVPPPKQAAKDALSGLQKLERKSVVAAKPLPKLQPLPSKLDNIAN
jgi:hypothetical protein